MHGRVATSGDQRELRRLRRQGMDVDLDACGRPEATLAATPVSTTVSEVAGHDIPPTAEIRRTLLSAVGTLTDRGLKLAAKWAAEQLVGLPDETPAEREQATQTTENEEPPPDREVEGCIAYAKCLMDVGEFERASKAFAHTSGNGDAGDTLPNRARFIGWYSRYLAGERRREEESQLTDALQRRRLTNPHLQGLLAELSRCDAEGSLDAFGLFIYAAVLKGLRAEGRGPGPDNPAPPIPPNAPTPRGTPSSRGAGGFMTPKGNYSTPNWRGVAGVGGAKSAAGMRGRDRQQARTPPGSGPIDKAAPPKAEGLGSAAKAQEVLERSLRLFPYNWSAWLDLATLCLETDTVPESLEADPPCPWMYQFFLQHLLVEQHRCKDALKVLETLHAAFPGSSYVLSQTAVAHYHLRNFDQGHVDFKELQRRDPLRMESLDIFSNILYVKECKAELSFLAHNAVKSAPMRPETSCIIGNYYSLKGQHEKAVTYFLRALRLDRRCLSAWTLMGHEFIELKNSGAAIESYRQAVDINPKDYRAWYGLGQAYEILQMHLYAIYYYRRATALRPYDARMWIAMGQCLEKLGKRREAISTYQRAMANDDREGVALQQLAKLYTQDGRTDKAAKCYETMLGDRLGEGADVHPGSAEDAMHFLCYYYKGKGDLAKSSKMAHALLDYTGTSREDALAVLREIRSILETRQQQQQQQQQIQGSRQSASNADGGQAEEDLGSLFPEGTDLTLHTPVRSSFRDAASRKSASRSRRSGRDTDSAARMRGADSSIGKSTPGSGGGVSRMHLGTPLSPSFMSRSPGTRSVAMSVEDDASRGNIEEDIMEGEVVSPGVGGGAHNGEESASDILSP